MSFEGLRVRVARYQSLPGYEGVFQRAGGLFFDGTTSKGAHGRRADKKVYSISFQYIPYSQGIGEGIRDFSWKMLHLVAKMPGCLKAGSLQPAGAEKIVRSMLRLMEYLPSGSTIPLLFGEFCTLDLKQNGEGAAQLKDMLTKVSLGVIADVYARVVRQAIVETIKTRPDISQAITLFFETDNIAPFIMARKLG